VALPCPSLEGIILDAPFIIPSIPCDSWTTRVDYLREPPSPQEHACSDGVGWLMTEWEVKVEDDFQTEGCPGGGAMGRDRRVRRIGPSEAQDARQATMTIRPFAQATQSYEFNLRAFAVPRHHDVPLVRLTHGVAHLVGTRRMDTTRPIGCSSRRALTLSPSLAGLRHRSLTFCGR
jgi:hypothetical protein